MALGSCVDVDVTRVMSETEWELCETNSGRQPSNLHTFEMSERSLVRWCHRHQSFNLIECLWLDSLHFNRLLRLLLAELPCLVHVAWFFDWLNHSLVSVGQHSRATSISLSRCWRVGKTEIAIATCFFFTNSQQNGFEIILIALPTLREFFYFFKYASRRFHRVLWNFSNQIWVCFSFVRQQSSHVELVCEWN